MITNVQELFPYFAERWKEQSVLRTWDDTTGWTEAVLGYLRAIGRAEGYEVYPDPEHPDDYYRHEYMSLDQCWTTEKDGKYWMQLAVESEWQGSEEPLEDFYTLAELKCPWKIMIFSANEDARNMALDQFSSWLRKLKFQLGHEWYLIMVFQRTDPRYTNGAYMLSGWLLDATGKRSELGTRSFAYGQQAAQY